MTRENVEKLNDEIRCRIEGLEDFEVGSEEEDKAIKALAALAKIEMEADKNNLDYDKHLDKLDFDREKSKSDIELKVREMDIRERENDVKEEQIEREYQNDVVGNDLKRSENELKEKQLKSDDMNAKIKFGVEVAGIALPIVTYVALFFKGLKFEETGSITSSMMRNLTGKFKLKK